MLDWGSRIEYSTLALQILIYVISLIFTLDFVEPDHVPRLLLPSSAATCASLHKKAFFTSLILRFSSNTLLHLLQARPAHHPEAAGPDDSDRLLRAEQAARQPGVHQPGPAGRAAGELLLVIWRVISPWSNTF